VEAKYPAYDSDFNPPCGRMRHSRYKEVLIGASQVQRERWPPREIPTAFEILTRATKLAHVPFLGREYGHRFTNYQRIQVNQVLWNASPCPCFPSCYQRASLSFPAQTIRLFPSGYRTVYLGNIHPGVLSRYFGLPQ
jgi:hypothetical protein